MCRVVFDHRYNRQLLGIGEVRLKRALHLKVVAAHQVYQVRVLDVPLQHVVAGEGAGSILLFRHAEIIQAVVGQNIHFVRYLRTELNRALGAIDIKVGKHTFLHCIVGGHDDVSRALGGLGKLIRRQ